MAGGIATGIFKKLAIKKQADLKTKAPSGAAGTAQYMRRVTSTIDLAKANYQSQEIIESQQVRDMRHGVKSVAGTISGELSVGGYQGPIESVCRQAAQAVAAPAANSTIVTAIVNTNQATLTRTGGSFLTEGFKLGDVVRAAGFVAPADVNNGKNLMIINLTATVMTVIPLNGIPLTAKAAGDPIVLTVVGKKTWMPQSNHTRDYWTIEHWHSDILQSEVFQDCVFTGFTANLPATGMATIEFPVMGLDMQPGVTEYFTSPKAAANGGITAAVNGVLIVNGTPAAIVTGVNIVVNGNYSAPGGVVGSNVDPDIFPGTLGVTGQITVLFKDGVYRDAFLNETEMYLAVALTENNSNNAGFVAFTMPRIKYTGATKNDGPTGLTLTMPFTALENVSGGPAVASLATTLSVQDSAFA